MAAKSALGEQEQGQRKGRYDVGQLARLAGVSPRTVRFYVAERLIPPPLGRGRGRHYDDAHLVRLLMARALQEAGLGLARIRSAFEHHYASDALMRGKSPPATPALEREFERTAAEGGGSPLLSPIPSEERIRKTASLIAASFTSRKQQGAAAEPRSAAAARSAWVRLELLPGVELHVSSEHRLPPPARLEQLISQCRESFEDVSADPNA